MEWAKIGALIAVVGCSSPELDHRHTVHELHCAWVRLGAEVFFILFSPFDVTHQANVCAVYFPTSLRKELNLEKMWVATCC